jgi:hypothetical protein
MKRLSDRSYPVFPWNGKKWKEIQRDGALGNFFFFSQSNDCQGLSSLDWIVVQGMRLRVG